MAEPIFTQLAQAILFIAAAVFWSAVGYVKKTGQTFEPVKFLETLIIAVILAVSAIVLGIPTPVAAEEWLIQSGMFGLIVVGVQWIAQLIYRKLLKYLPTPVP